ncbi:MAG TPA: hypothetical protein VK624_04460 [Steroidobacteraceae bacterium]|nr:hypothetical protein [Steroidobacteraceae bacterium]
MKRAYALVAALTLCAGAIAANNTPLSGAWNIAPSGSAASTGELVFRMTPGDGSDPVEVTVTVHTGTNDIGVARDIRQALSAQLRRDQFNVQLGEGANVLVTDPRGKPNFSLELLDSDVENLRVVVQSVAAAAPPTVPEQAVPATPPQTAPAPNTAPGNALPPPTPPPGNAAPPAAPPPESSPPMPNDSPPPNTGGAGQPASAPPPIATPGDAAASAPPRG